MIAFGYEKDNDEEKLMKLSETTLQCNNEELDRIIDFLNRIKNTNYEAGDHQNRILLFFQKKMQKVRDKHI